MGGGVYLGLCCGVWGVGKRGRVWMFDFVLRLGGGGFRGVGRGGF